MFPLTLRREGALERDLVSTVEYAIADGVSNGGIAEVVVPALVLELASDHGSAQAVAVFKNFQEVTPALFGERRDGEVIEHEHVELGEACEKPLVCSVSACEAQFVEEAWHAAVEARDPLRHAWCARAQAK